MRIYLIGYMGSGKSKTAEALSKILKFNYLDTDLLIEKRINKSIAAVFKGEGQEYFRELEREVLHETLKSDKLVISTGGGTPCFFDNMEWMNTHGITVYLEANAGLLFHRLATSREGRPLIEHLNDVELMEQIVGHLAVRIPVYQQALIKINAANINVKFLAEKIMNFKKKSSTK